MPAVSVIIPIYGVEQFISRCAETLFCQTLDNIEYIFVNDCTPDKSVEILEKVLKQYPNRKNQTKIINHEKNKGISATRQTGLDNTTGDYIIHVDSDDYIEKDMLERLYKQAISENADITWCDFYTAYPNRNIIRKQECNPTNIEMIKAIMNGKMQGSLCNKLVRKELYTQNNINFPYYNMIEDAVVNIKLLLTSKKNSYCPKPLYYYYYNPQSITNNADKILSVFQEYQHNVNAIIDIINKNNLATQLQKEIMFLKLTCKSHIYPLCNKKEIRKLWLNTYPESNSYIYSYPLKNKYIGIALHLRVYPVFHLFFKIVRKILH